MNGSNTRKLVMCALLMAICFVVTRFISVPVFYTKGYVNLGDLVVLISAYVLGGWYGAAAAALGSLVADASMGFYIYIPATFVIKGAMVFIAGTFFARAQKHKDKLCFVFYICTGAVLAELFMVSAYFIYEILLYKSIVVALTSVVGNLIQGLTCVVPATMIILIFSKNPSVSGMINNLRK